MTAIKKNNGDLIAENRRARFDYHIEDTIEAGLELTGTEVKSLRLGKANITQSYAGEQGNELFVFGLHIEEYAQAAEFFQHDARRTRRLLLKRSEINKLIGSIQREGVTLIPMRLYFNKRGMAKLQLGVATGKKQHEKRDAIKKRDWQRDKARIMRDNN
jgi:SsrA-binding protein